MAVFALFGGELPHPQRGETPELIEGRISAPIRICHWIPLITCRRSRGTSGTVDVADTTWVTYTDDTREPIWIAGVDGVRLLITGSGDEEEFRTLAAAATGGETLPR